MQLLLLEDIRISQSDFDAWRDEITHCVCRLCSDANRFRPLDFTGRERLVAAVVLLEELKAGRHEHVSYHQAAVTAWARSIVTGTWGYMPRRFSLMQSGIGAGMTPGGVR